MSPPLWKRVSGDEHPDSLRRGISMDSLGLLLLLQRYLLITRETL